MRELVSSSLFSGAALDSYSCHHLQLLWAVASNLHLEEYCKPEPSALSHTQVRAGESFLHGLLLEMWDGDHLMEWDLGSCNVEHSDLELLRS